MTSECQSVRPHSRHPGPIRPEEESHSSVRVLDSAAVDPPTGSGEDVYASVRRPLEPADGRFSGQTPGPAARSPQHQVVAQSGMIVGVFIAQREGKNPLAQQGCKIMINLAGLAPIIEPAGQIRLSACANNGAPPFEEISPPAKSAATRRFLQAGNSIFEEVQSVTAKSLRYFLLKQLNYNA